MSSESDPGRKLIRGGSSGGEWRGNPETTQQVYANAVVALELQAIGAEWWMPGRDMQTVSQERSKHLRARKENLPAPIETAAGLLEECRRVTVLLGYVAWWSENPFPPQEAHQVVIHMPFKPRHILDALTKLAELLNCPHPCWPEAVTMDSAIRWCHELEILLLEADLGSGDSSDPPMLTRLAAAVYELLVELPVHRGMTGAEIIDALRKNEPPLHLDQSTLTSRIVPELKPYGIENAPRIGYRIKPSRRPNN